MALLDDLVGALQIRLRQAKQAKRLFANDTALADKVAISIARMPLLPEPDPAPASGSGMARKSYWMRIREHFSATGNEWITATNLAASVGMSKAVLCTILYRTHKADLESAPHPGYLRTKLWRMRPETTPENLRAAGFSS